MSLDPSADVVVVVVVVVVRNKVRQPYISRTFVARTTKFSRLIHADRPYIWTGYDITNSFRSEAIAKKTVESTASGGFM